MTRFHWVRHGPTHAKAMIGWTDLPADLSDHRAVARLAAFLPDAAGVISSDLIRAVTTAGMLQAGRPRLPHDPGLREIHFGAWERHSFAAAEAENPALIRAFWETPGDLRAPGGESWNELCARVHATTDRLATLYPQGNIIIVAHFGAILAALQRAGGLTPTQVFAHKIDNLSVTEISLSGADWNVGRINHRP